MCLLCWVRHLYKQIIGQHVVWSIFRICTKESKKGIENTCSFETTKKKHEIYLSHAYIDSIPLLSLLLAIWMTFKILSAALCGASQSVLPTNTTIAREQETVCVCVKHSSLEWIKMNLNQNSFIRSLSHSASSRFAYILHSVVCLHVHT